MHLKSTKYLGEIEIFMIFGCHAKFLCREIFEAGVERRKEMEGGNGIKHIKESI